MNAVTGRWKLGLFLALCTSIMWGLLPVALDAILTSLNAATTTFFRFALAALVLTPYLLVRKRLINQHKLLSPKLALQLLIAGLLLAANYGLYIVGIALTSAEATQVMMQLAPMLLLLAGVWLFNEPFTLPQWLGFASFGAGLVMFFSHHLHDIFVSPNQYATGLLIIALSAICWTGYAIVQKMLLREFQSGETMLIIYWLGALIFLPFSDFSPILQLNAIQWALLIFCGFNTLIAYGCFAEALVHTEASRVSATIAITPLITVAIVQLIPLPGIAVEPITVISIAGAVLVVCGSITTATVKKP